MRDKLEQIIRLAQTILDSLAEPATGTVNPSPVPDIAWGAKVSPVFKERVIWIADDLGFNVDWLMACMAFESNETFQPDIKNMAGSGATGLIQFMPSTANALGTDTDKLAAMTAEDQLNFVWKYFSPFKGKLNSLEDLYMAILWPRAVGRANNYVLFRGPDAVTYRQNRGLDTNRDNNVTKAEAAAKVREKLIRGEQYRG